MNGGAAFCDECINDEDQIDLSEKKVYKVAPEAVVFKYRKNETLFVGRDGDIVTFQPQGKENYILADGKRYRLFQIYIHSPSKHVIDGEKQACSGEIQFIHKDYKKKLAVVSVFVKGKKKKLNRDFDRLLRNIPKNNKHKKIRKRVKIGNLVPKKSKIYHYIGRLAVPPYTKNTKWFVMKKPIYLSKWQVKDLKRILGKRR